MPTKFAVGEDVLVPAARLAQPDRQPYALMPRTVLALAGRSVRVDDGAGGTVDIDRLGRQLCERPVGMLA